MKILQVIGRFFQAVFKPIEANAVTFVALYVLGVVSAWLTVPNTPSGKFYANTWLELFLDLYLLCAVLMLFPQPHQKERNRAKGLRRAWLSVGGLRGIVKLLLCIVLYAVALADVYCFEKYGSSLSPSMLMLVGETDSREAGEFLNSVFQWETLTSGVGWLLLIALCHIVASWLVRHFRGIKLHSDVSTVVGVIVAVLLVWAAIASWKNKQGLWRLMTLPTVGALENEVTRYHRAE